MRFRVIRPAVVMLGVFLLLGAAACGDDDDDNVPTDSPAATATTVESSDTPVATPTEEPFSGARDPVEKEAPVVPPVAIQTGTRYSGHSGYDRVVFDFTENAPGYLIQYVDPPIKADPSDMDVEIDGQAFIQIRFLGAQAHDDSGNTTVDELEIFPGLTSILEIERTGDFEAQLTWVLGLPGELDFRVSDLADPTRVVIDVGHP